VNERLSDLFGYGETISDGPSGSEADGKVASGG